MIDDGYFPRGQSVLREVHEQRAVGLMYGQRALGIGALAPLNFIGTARNTRDGVDRPFRRLVHSAQAFEAIHFGTRAEADTMLAMVHRMHTKVEGELAEDAGPFSKGTPYSAFDPELMLWTVAVMFDSALYFYELFVRRLSPAEREALWQDYIRFAELFEMPRDAAPPTYPDFRAWYEDRLISEEAHLTDEARYVGHAVMFHIPVTAAEWPQMRVHNLVLLGSLPKSVRAAYGLSWTSAQAVAFRAVVAGSRAVRPLMPAKVLIGSCDAYFERVWNEEDRRVSRGEPIRGALSSFGPPTQRLTETRSPSRTSAAGAGGGDGRRR